VALGLAGCDSDKAWAMRDDLVVDYDSPGYVVLSLAGDNITFVWQLKNKPILEEKAVEQKINHGSAQEFDENVLKNKINDYLTKDSILAKDYNLSLKTKVRQNLSQSKNIAKIFSAMIKEVPKLFLETMSAKKDARQITKKLAAKAFPSILWSKSENDWRGWGGYAGFESSELFSEPNPEDYLSPQSMNEMLAGNPEHSVEKNEEVMRFREPINDLVVTGIYGKLSGNNWDSSYQFPIDKKVMEKAKDITITLPKVGPKSILPKLLGSEIVIERVRGIRKGEEIPLTVDISPLGSGIVEDTKKCQEIVYSIEIDEVPSAMKELSREEYNSFKEKFIRENGQEATVQIAEFPEEIDLFLEQIKTKNPKEQVQAIEQFVRFISYYDMKNAEMMGLKRGKTLDERLEIMRTRIDELRERGNINKEVLQNKMYAGVCADFAVLTAAILRRAGFISGVLSGFMSEGNSVKIHNAHGSAFVVWPNQRGGNEIFAVDGTPTELEGISRPSLAELEKIREEKINEITKEANEKLDEIMEILASHDEESIKKLSNGELEKVLNTVLRYDVKQENLQAITGLLQAYWYSPIHKLDFNEIGDKVKFLEFFESEIKSARQSKIEPVADPGNRLFETVETFVQRFAKDENLEKSLDIIDSIASLVGNKLSKSESKALTVVTTYLRAKKIIV